MTVPAIPIILVTGAVIALSGKKSKKPLAGSPCKDSENPPEGYACSNGILREKVSEESELDSDSDFSPEASGDFDVLEEDISLSDGESGGSEPLGVSDTQSPDPEKTCEEFMAAIYVQDAAEDEIPIHEVAVEETILPAMKKTASEVFESLGVLDHDIVGPALVVSSLEALIPVCRWRYNEQDFEFTYDDGRKIDSEIAKEVLYGLIEISVQVLDDFQSQLNHPGQT